MNQGPTVFDFQAEVGLTKHVDSLPATQELMALCHIEPGSDVLDVGCGVGPTPCCLAKERGASWSTHPVQI